MTKKQFDKLIEYIDAAIKESHAQDTSDGGLTETMAKDKIRDELEQELVDKWND